MARRLNTRFLTILTVVVLGLMVGAVAARWVSNRAFARRNAARYMALGNDKWQEYLEKQKSSKPEEFAQLRILLLGETDRPESGAMGLYGQSLQRDKGNLDLMVKYGDVLHQAVRYDPMLARKDLERWERALEIDPSYAPALQRLFDAWVEIFEIQPSVETCVKLGEKARALARVSNDLRPRVYEHIAVIAGYVAGRATDGKTLEKCVEELRKLAGQAGADARIQAEIPRAIAGLRLRQAAEQAASTDPTVATMRREQAIAVFKEAVKAQPENALLLYYYYQVLASGAAAEQAGQSDAETERQLDELSKKAAELAKPEQRKYVEIRLLRVGHLAQHGKLKEAEEDARKLLGEQPEWREDQWVRLMLAKLLHNQPGKRQEAIQLLSRPVNDDPTIAGWRAMSERARALYATCLDRATYRIEAYGEAGAKEQEGLKARIEEDYRKAVTILGSDQQPDILKLKGRMLLVLQGDKAAVTEAAVILRKAYDKLDRRIDPDLTVLLAQVYSKLEQSGQAMSLLERLLERQRANTSLRSELVRIYVAEKLYDKARPHVAELEKQLANDPEVIGFRTVLLVMDNKIAEAQKLAQSLPAGNDAERFIKAQALFNARAYAEAEKLLVGPCQNELAGDSIELPLNRMLFAVYSRQNKTQQAKALAQQALAKHPKDSWWLLAGGAKPADIDIQDPIRRAIQRFNLDRLKDADGALSSLQEVEKKSGADGRIADEIFNYALDAGKVDLADEYCEKLRKLNWDQAGGLAYESSLKLAKSDVDGALQAAGDLSRKLPDFSRTWVVLGKAQQKAGQLESAINSFNKALGMEVDNAGALRGLVECYSQLGDVHSAEEVEKRGKDLRPPSNRWFIDFEVMQVERSDPQRVTKLREDNLERGRDDVNNWYVLADNYFRVAIVLAKRNGDAKGFAEYVAKAQRLLSEAMEKWPDEMRLYVQKATLFFYSGKPEEAVQIFRQLQEREKWKDRPEPWQQLATYQAAMKDGVSAAEQSMLTAVQKSKNSGTTVQHALRQALATFYLRTGKMDKAIDTMTKLVEETNNPQLRQRLTQILVQAGRHQEAERWLRESLRETPSNSNVLALVGFVKLKQRSYPEAVEQLNLAIRAEPKDAVAHYYMGMTKLETGDWAEAERELVFASTLRPADADVRAGLAELYRRRNRLEDACRELQVAIRVDPMRADLRQQLIMLYSVDKRWPPVETLLEEARSNQEMAQDPVWLQTEARMWLARDNVEKALAALDGALKLQPGNPQTWALLLEVMVRAKAWPQVIARVEQVQPVERQWWMYMRRAQAEKELGKLEPAKADFERAMSAIDSMSAGGADSAAASADAMADAFAETLTATMLQSMGEPQVVEWLSVRQNPRWSILLARLYFQRRDPTSAIKIVDSLLGRNGPTLTENQRLMVLQKAGQIYQTSSGSDVQLLKKARQAYVDYLDLLTRYHGELTDQLIALNNLAMLLAEHPTAPSPQEALSYSRRAYEIMTKANMMDPGVLDTYGWVLLLCGQVDPGMDQLRMAVAQKAPPPEAFYHLGEAFLRKGRLVQAEENFKLAQSMLRAAADKKQDVDAALVSRVEAALQKMKGNAGKTAAAVP